MTPEAKKQLEVLADRYADSNPALVNLFMRMAQAAWELATQPYKCPLTGGDLTSTRTTAELATELRASMQTSGDDERDAVEATKRYWTDVSENILRSENGFYDGYLAGRSGTVSMGGRVNSDQAAERGANYNWKIEAEHYRSEYEKALILLGKIEHRWESDTHTLESRLKAQAELLERAKEYVWRYSDLSDGDKGADKLLSDLENASRILKKYGDEIK